MRKKLTQDFLKECLTYNPETGIFIWNTRPLSHFKTKSIWKTWNSRLSGKEAGSISYGYVQVSIDKKKYGMHRLAFLYMEGYFPENQVDHIDRIRSNNKWDNLREVSNQCNSQNCNIKINNTSGVCGVVWHNKPEKWSSSIMIDGKGIHLGLFKNFDDAVMRRYYEELNNKNWTCSVESTAYKYLKGNNLLDKFYNKDFSCKIKSCKNTSGVTGVSWNKIRNKWIVYTTNNKKYKYIGLYTNFNDAVMAKYQDELDKYDLSSLHKSSAYKYLKDNNLI